MAFLCPTKIRREWKKLVKSTPKPAVVPGRITGSSSVDTLVFVQNEKLNGKKKPVLRVTQQFDACVAEELTVKAGDIVQLLYQDNEWLYCICGEQEGFIPARFCVPVDRLGALPETKQDESTYSIEQMMSRCQVKEMKMQQVEEEDVDCSSFDTSSVRDCDGLGAKLKAKLKVKTGTDDEYSSGFHSDIASPRTPLRSTKLNSKTSLRNTSGVNPSLSTIGSVKSNLQHRPKNLKNREQFLVLFAFQAESEGDLSVYKGQTITVLNKDNEHWFWCGSKAGEGYVPSSHLIPVETCDQSESEGYCADESVLDESFVQTVEPTPRRAVPRKLTVLFDYIARSADDLTVCQGNAVYCDISNQEFDDWLWVYSPITGQQGFIPKPFAKLPHTNPLITSL